MNSNVDEPLPPAPLFTATACIPTGLMACYVVEHHTIYAKGSLAFRRPLDTLGTREKEVPRICEVHRRLSESLDRWSVLTTSLDLAAELLQADGALVCLTGNDNPAIKTTGDVSFTDDHEKQSCVVEDGVLDALERGERVIAMESSPGPYPSDEKKAGLSRSTAGFPLLPEGGQRVPRRAYA